MGETLWDLYREAGLAPSPAVRAAREGAPPPLRPPLNSPAAQAYNQRQQRRRVAPHLRAEFARQGQRQAYAPPRNQIAELPQLALEATGLPSVRRAASEYTRLARGETGDLSAANEQAIWGAIGVGGWAVPAGRGRAPAPRTQPFPDFGALPQNGPRTVPYRDLPQGTFDSFDPFGARGDYGDALRASNVSVEPLALSDLPAPQLENPALARSYAERTSSAPPILVQRIPNGVRIADGNHRVEAARLRGDQSIDAIDLEQFRALSEGRTQGTPDISADPMVARRPPGMPPNRPPSMLRAPNEDRYLFGRPPPRTEALDRALLSELETVPPLRAHEGSWIGTSPSGEVREFFSEANAQKALKGGWTVETANTYLARINRGEQLPATNAPNGSAARPPPDQTKTYRSNKPPAGGFLFGRRH